VRLRDRVVQNGRRTFSRWGRFPVEREEKRAAQLIPARRERVSMTERCRTGGALFPARGRPPVEREEKRAAQLIPARRQPQATHGTYRGGGVVGRAGVTLPETPLRLWGVVGA